MSKNGPSISVFTVDFLELNVAGYLVRNPAALALLLEAAGPSAMEAVGRLLYRRLMKKHEP